MIAAWLAGAVVGAVSGTCADDGALLLKVDDAEVRLDYDARPGDDAIGPLRLVSPRDVVTDGLPAATSGDSNASPLCADGECQVHARLPGPVTAVAPGDGTAIVAFAGERGGLARVVGESTHVLASGRAAAFCASAGSVWALLRDGELTSVVRADARSPAVRVFDASEVLALSMVRSPRWPSDATTLRVLDAARAWAVGEVLAVRAARSESEAVRRAAADRLGAFPFPSVAAVASLWILAHDPSTNVRRAAWEATLRACPEPGADCTARVLVFVDDPTGEAGWEARDHLLRDAPALALEGATRGYKLGLLNRLTVTLERGGPLVPPVLALLRADPDAEVRQLAEAVIDWTSP